MSEEDINFLISIQDLEQPEFDNACLERENKRLKEENDILCSIANGEKEKVDTILELLNRINKAIEYIEENETTFNVHNVANEFGIPTLEFVLEPWKKELLDILKGVDKE